LTRNALARDPERGARRRGSDVRESRDGCGALSRHVVEDLPRAELAAAADQLGEPAPGFASLAFGHVDLEEALRAALAADERAVAFGERCRRQHEIRRASRRMRGMVDDDQMLDSRAKAFERGARRSALEIVLEHDRCADRLSFGPLERVVEN